MTPQVLFRNVGRYEIRSRLASGGMADVYAAHDAETGQDVALKIPRLAEPGLRESERQGALLQQHLSHIDSRVPQVYDIGELDGVMYVAMEYVAGEDLSECIGRGPIPAHEAAGIAAELCGVLAAAHSYTTTIGERSFHGVVHGDIKPKNVRILPDGGVKVLDFGIAKALSLSRRLTRNEFGSLPYASPERIESGHVDACSDLWSVGVVLYEMLAGRQPFHGDSTRRLEGAILSRELPPALPESCPRALEAIVRKVLAPAPDRRYASAGELQADLLALTRGETTSAERQDEAARLGSEATRRTHAPAPTEPPHAEATRRTVAPAAGAPAEAASTDIDTTRRSSGPSLSPAPSIEAGRIKAPLTASQRLGRVAVGAALVMAALAALVLIHEIRVFRAARDFRASLATLRRSDAEGVWAGYRALEGRSWLGFATMGVEGAVKEWLVASADELLAQYRSETPTIRETGWEQASSLLTRALSLSPRDRQVRARLRYCQGHIARINGEARAERSPAEAGALFNESVAAFEDAAKLWPKWPDPHLGLARAYVYGSGDLDRASEALERAGELGYRMGKRETALLADAHRRRAVRMWAERSSITNLPQEKGYLERIHEDCERALELYEKIPAFGDVSRNVRAMQQLLEKVEARQEAIDRSSRWWWW